MTTNPMAWEGAINPRVAENQCAQDCLLPMGEPGHCFGLVLCHCEEGCCFRGRRRAGDQPTAAPPTSITSDNLAAQQAKRHNWL